MEKIKALAEYLDVEVSEIEESKFDSNIFEHGFQEYLVLTDGEADEEAEERIKESLWAFNGDFIIAHSSALGYDEGSRSIVKAIQEQYENGNVAVERLIDDLDEFIYDAIETDGRGHFIANYDSEEVEQGDFFIYRMN